jgi:hypothetical protein
MRWAMAKATARRAAAIVAGDIDFAIGSRAELDRCKLAWEIHSARGRQFEVRVSQAREAAWRAYWRSCIAGSAAEAGTERVRREPRLRRDFSLAAPTGEGSAIPPDRTL